MKPISTISNKKGVSLVFVILVLLVMSILAVAVFTLFTSNIAQAKYQDDSIRAHFVAISGVEVGFAALLADDQKLLNDYFKKPNATNVIPISDTITLDEGTASITISSFVEEDLRYVMIKSVGSISGSSVTQELKMKFRIEYPEIQTWD